MKTSPCTDGQMVAVLKEAAGGTPVRALRRTHGSSSATFYKWRANFGGMDVSLMASLNELEDAHRRIKQLYFEAQLSVDRLSRALERKLRITLRRRVVRETPRRFWVARKSNRAKDALHGCFNTAIRPPMR